MSNQVGRLFFYLLIRNGGSHLALVPAPPKSAKISEGVRIFCMHLALRETRS